MGVKCASGHIYSIITGSVIVTLYENTSLNMLLYRNGIKKKKTV